MLGLSACSGGGGSSTSASETVNTSSSNTQPSNRASEIVITPSANTASQTGSSTSEQTTVIKPVVQKPILTDIQLTTTRQNRKLNVRMTLVPADADWTWINFDNAPDDAGRPCCYYRFEENFFYAFECKQGYNGDVTFTTIVSQRNGPDVHKSASFTCR